MGREDGTDTTNQAPGGGSPALRRQLKVLSEFLRGFDLATLQPDTAFVQRAPGVVVRTLSFAGNAYAMYLQGRGPTTLGVSLPPGRWTVEWLNVEDGTPLQRQTASGAAKEPTLLTSPEFADAVAVRLFAQRAQGLR